MKTNKYETLDREICAYIARNCGHPIYSCRLALLARPLLAAGKTPDPEEWRLIDRRMQAMRRTGRLAYERKNGGWRVVDA